MPLVLHSMRIAVLLLLGICGVLAGEDRLERANREVENLSSGDSKVRLDAVVALVDPDQVGIVPESALLPLLKIAREDPQRNRSWALTALSKLGPKYASDTVPVLVDALNDESEEIVVSAIEGLGRLRTANSIAALAKLAQSEDRVIRHYAGDALARIGTEEAKAAYLTYVKANAPELIAIVNGPDGEGKPDAGMYLLKMQRALNRLGLTNIPEYGEIKRAWSKGTR